MQSSAALNLDSLEIDDIAKRGVGSLERKEQERLLELLGAMERRQARNLFADLFPDNDNTLADGTVIYSRARYARHVEFFNAGLKYRERCFLAANRVGKTTGAAYECTCHLTGKYPHWWRGRRFANPISAWACGKQDETTRDIVQAALLGDVSWDTPDGRKGFSGKGMIPVNLIGRATWKRGVDDLADVVMIKHASGAWSKLGFKSYKQGRGSFEGTARDLIWLDEECPLDVYGECLVRTATTNGLIMLTFTPLEGLTETVMQFQMGAKL